MSDRRSRALERHPGASSPEVRERMQHTRQRDTACELLLRKALHSLGVRYRIDRPLPISSRRRSDLLIASRRVAIFVDGCFWHGCPEHRTYPKANRAWWESKIEANIARDRDTDQRLSEAGWLSIRVWEHELPTEAARRIATLVASRRRYGRP